MDGKVSIIGGAGRVGSNAAYALQCGHSCAEIVLVDVAADVAKGEALDLTHGRAAVGGPRIAAGDCTAAAGSDIVIVTAGLRRKPEESRLELINRNVSLFRQLVGNVQRVALPADAILLVVANPVDVLTYLAGAELGWAQARTVGLGTVLDTQRFLSLLGERIDVDPSRLTGFILGEHGDSMVPAYSTLRFDGAPLTSVPGYSEAAAQETFEATRTAGAECLRLKGGAGYAVGLAIRQVVEAILGDTGAVLPVSTIHRGDAYGETAFSLPTRVGRTGLLGFADVTLTEDEHRAVKGSAEVLAQTIASVRGQ
jgi:L-lactate dehydrogenase